MVMKAEPIFSNACISISDLKKNPSAAIAAAEGFPLAILNRNKPAAYLVPAKAWEAIIDQLDEIELVRIARERWDQLSIAVDIDDLASL